MHSERYIGRHLDRLQRIQLFQVPQPWASRIHETASPAQLPKRAERLDAVVNRSDSGVAATVAGGCSTHPLDAERISCKANLMMHIHVHLILLKHIELQSAAIFLQRRKVDGSPSLPRQLWECQ